MTSHLNLLNYFMLICFILTFSVTESTLTFKYLTEKQNNEEEIKEGDSLEILIELSDQNNADSEINCQPYYGGIVKLNKIDHTSNGATFRVKGRRLGEEVLICRTNEETSEIEVPVTVLRKHSNLDVFFVPYVFVMVALFNVAFGTEITINDLRFIVQKPGPLFVAALCQFVLLPPLGLGIARVMKYEPDVALGFLMVACAPGGGDSNAASFLVDGELPLSICMTFFSTILAIGTMPLNLFIYGRFITDDSNWTPKDIPYGRMVLTLLILVAPVAVGMILNNRFPQKTDTAMRYGKPVILFLLIIFIGLAIARNFFALNLVDAKDVLGSCLLPLGGFFIGGFMSLITNQRFSQVKTIALEVGMQNAGIVIGMSLIVFDQPKADLNAILPIFIALCETLLTIPFLLVHVGTYRLSRRYRELCKRNKEQQKQARDSFDDSMVEKENGDKIKKEETSKDRHAYTNSNYQTDHPRITTMAATAM